MKVGSFFLMFACATAAALFVGCSPSKDADDRPSAKQSSEAESRVKQGTNGEVIVTVDMEAQKTMGLHVATLAANELNPKVKGYGRVLDASPLAALVTELAADQSASAASEAEFKRMKGLALLDNASERALQAAEAAAIHDQSQTDSVRQRLLAGWGSVIAGRTDLPAFAQSLLSQESALVEIALPAGESLQSSPTGAELTTLADETKPVEAQFIGPAAMIDPQVQGQPFLFLVRPNVLHLAPGAAVTGWLTVPGKPVKGVLAPESAIVRYQEKAWVYVASGDSNFVRTEVVLDHPVEKGWMITGRLQPGERVVTSGAQILLSEELKSLTPLQD